MLPDLAAGNQDQVVWQVDNKNDCMYNSNHRDIYQNWAVESNMWLQYEGLGQHPAPKMLSTAVSGWAMLNRQSFFPIVFLRAQGEGLC